MHPKYRKAALRFISMTTPVYLCLFIVLILLRSKGYDHFSDTALLISMGHIFILQTIHWLMIQSRKHVSREYMASLLWFMVYNNILLFCYWLVVLHDTRSFIYILAPMSVIALFSITDFRRALIYNVVLAISMSVSVGISTTLRDYSLHEAGLDWIYITSVLIIGIWLSYLADLYLKNRQKLHNAIKATKDSKSKLEYTLKQLYVAHEQLEKISCTDALTQVPNRRHFDNTIEYLWNVACSGEKPMSVLMIDVDHFKKFNDDHGHQIGDQCLQLVAENIRSCLGRQGDEISRYGGEEFAVILPDTSATAAVSVADRIRLCIESHPLVTEDKSLTVHVSIGISTLDPLSPLNDYDELICKADSALYQAKEQGRNRVVHNKDIPDNGECHA